MYLVFCNFKATEEVTVEAVTMEATEVITEDTAVMNMDNMAAMMVEGIKLTDNIMVV